MNVVHKELAIGRWHAMTLAEQLGNVGSEYDRAHRSRHLGDVERFQHASNRFLELFELTLSDPRWRGPRLRELARVREAACEELFSSESTEKAFDQYFLYFAISARRRR